MAVVQIPNLPAAIALSGSEQLEAVQAGTSVRITVAQIGQALGSPASPNLSLQFNNGGVFGGSSGITTDGVARITLGDQQTSQGSLVLANTAAGAWPVTIQSSNSATAAWTMTLPPAVAAGNGFILTSNTSGVTSWTNPTALGIDLDVGSTAITNGTVSRLLFQGAGNVLQQSANLTFSSSTLTLGVAGSATGAAAFTGATSGTATITAQATAGSPTLTLPNASGTLVSTASAPLSINATTGAISITGAAGQVLAGATPAFTATPTLGVAGATAGTLALSGATSGTVTLQTAAAAGTGTIFQFPSSNGANGTVLTTTGSGVTTWTSPSALGIDLDVGTTAITNGTAGRVLFQGAGDVLQQSANLFWDSANNQLDLAAGTEAIPALSTVSDSNTGLWFPAADTIAASTGGTERMLITSAGNVGIGTATANQRLVINGGNSTTAIYMENGATSVGYFGTYFGYFSSGSTSDLAIATYAANIIFANNGTEKMRITSAGDVGIGTSAPSYKLDVTGIIRAKINSSGDGTGVLLTDNGTANGRVEFITSDATGRYRLDAIGDARFSISTVSGGVWGEAFSIDRVTRNVGIGTTSPGDRFVVENASANVKSRISAGGSASYTASLALGTTTRDWEVTAGNSSSNYLFSLNYTGTDAPLSNIFVATKGGNVGIGTTSPVVRLYVADTTSVSTAFDVTSGGVNGRIYDFYYTTNLFRQRLINDAYSSATDAYELGRSGMSVSYHRWLVSTGTEAMRITSAGNVGIGTASPNGRVQINDSSRIFDTWGNLNVVVTDAAATDIGGAIAFGAQNTAGGTSPLYVAKIQGIKETSASSYNGALVFGTTAASSALIERMRITSAGNVGIGTASPGAALDVFGNIYTSNATTSGAAALVGRAAGSNTWIVGPDNSINGGTDQGLSLYSYGATNVRFYTNATERMRIDSSGNVGIGTTSVTSTRLGVDTSLAGTVGLQVNSSVASGYASTLFYGTSTSAAGTGFDMIGCYANSVTQFRVRGDGTIYAQNTTVQSASDIRLKENVRSATDGLSIILGLRPVRFDWKNGFGNGRKNQLGFVAQEVESVFSDAVDEMAITNDSNEKYKTVGPSALIPVLVKAVQELAAEVAALKGASNG